MPGPTFQEIKRWCRRIGWPVFGRPRGQIIAVQGRRVVGPCLAGVWLILSSCACEASAPPIKATDPHSPIRLGRTIALPDTKGRIDHLAVDLTGRRLFVAEVANGTVDTIDLRTGAVVNRISGLKEPQGVAWLPVRQELIVACGDGSVHFYGASGQREIAVIPLGDDADNVRIDDRNGQVVVGYGSGGLATIDPASHKVIHRVIFKGHPESFRLMGGNAFVNVPGNAAILAVDRDRQKVTARWSTGVYRLNFPMALDPATHSAVIAFRFPAVLARVDMATGAIVESRPTCGDSDDLFLDGDREIVVCGTGHIHIVEKDRTEARIETEKGSRTALFVPELRTLFLAVPARGHQAAIWEMRVSEAHSSRG
ncbi:hypothetical protein [Sphingobium sp. Sx8-8]|uniref:YncE family protein n=1 Tax=Sphingobium sp. Sx8-8 TaxID=2933617 RepID=UPI001F562508|nr:hypothetical protein [Sphingobium sp. Sx8-8]